MTSKPGLPPMMAVALGELQKALDEPVDPNFRWPWNPVNSTPSAPAAIAEMRAFAATLPHKTADLAAALGVNYESLRKVLAGSYLGSSRRFVGAWVDFNAAGASRPTGTTFEALGAAAVARSRARVALIREQRAEARLALRDKLSRCDANEPRIKQTYEQALAVEQFSGSTVEQLVEACASLETP